MELVCHANGMADRLRAGIGASNSVRLAWSDDSSKRSFRHYKEDAGKTAEDKGAKFLRMADPVGHA